jgi:7-carboxy-7-deazaguanine synthase
VDASPLDISEIFYSIQGESTCIGLPCVFIRLSFCNLRCRWCDSAYTFTPGQTRTVEEILEQVDGFPCRLVEVTGGEPLLQEGVFPLMERLCDDGYEVLLETSGSLDITRVDARVRRIVDVKCPGSDMADRNRWPNLDCLTGRDEVKFVIANRADYTWARDIVRERNLDQRCPILMSPVFGELENIDLARWILDDGLPVRYQLQLHKYIWDPRARGV